MKQEAEVRAGNNMSSAIIFATRVATRMVRERQAHCCADPHLDMPVSLHSKCESASTWRQEVETRKSNACDIGILSSWNSRRDEPYALVYVRVGDRANHLSTLQAPQPRSLSSLVPPAGLHEPASGIGACISVCDRMVQFAGVCRWPLRIMAASEVISNQRLTLLPPILRPFMKFRTIVTIYQCFHELWSLPMSAPYS